MFALPQSDGLRLWLAEIFLELEPDRARVVRRCAVAALLLVVCAYPDVILRGASVSAANFLNITIEPRPEKVQILPERSGREAYHAYYDVGGAAFQSEPSAQFMARALWGGQSVYWNPYSASGSYGIETIVDVKTSPLSMAVALLGGSDLAFHAAYLGFSYLGTFCLLLLLTLYWRLSFISAIAGGVTYLLNGYNVANLASNVSQTWFYFPVLALALVSFAKSPSVASWLGIVGGSVLILSVTFLPTTLILLGTCIIIGAATAVACVLARKLERRAAIGEVARISLGQLAGVLLALLILAVVYLPIAEALRYMDTSEYYGARRFFPATLVNFISLFSPKHAFEAYNAATAKSLELRGNVAFHQGIVGALLATQAVRAWPVFHRTIVAVVATALVLVILRIYGMPVVTQIVDVLPVIGNIGEQYIWVAAAALFTFLVPFGVHGMLGSGVRVKPLACGALTILAALAYASHMHGIQDRVAIFYVSVAVLLVASTILILLNVHRSVAPVLPAIALVLLSWGELTFYVDHSRLSRTDRFSDPPPLVRFLQQHEGLHRVASYGHWGVPAEYGSAYGLYQIDSMNFHLMPRYVALFDRLILPKPDERWTTFITLVRAGDTDNLNLQAFDLVGTKYITVPIVYPRLRKFMEQSDWKRVYEDLYFVVFENPDPLPRAFVVHRLVADEKTPVDVGQSPRVMATSSDPILLEEARRAGPLGAENNIERAADTARITRYDHARVEIEAELAAPGILVLTDVWHPNWTVTVDGEERHLGIVNEAFRGVVLPPGKHRIEMRYAPQSLAAAQVVSGSGLLFIALLFAVRRKLGALQSSVPGNPAATRA